MTYYGVSTLPPKMLRVSTVGYPIASAWLLVGRAAETSLGDTSQFLKHWLPIYGLTQKWFNRFFHQIYSVYRWGYSCKRPQTSSTWHMQVAGYQVRTAAAAAHTWQPATCMWQVVSSDVKSSRPYWPRGQNFGLGLKDFALASASKLWPWPRP